MSQAPSRLSRQTAEPEPAWEVAYLFPPQGQWTEGDYLALNTHRRVELSDGCIEVLPMPTITHQRLIAYLYGLLLSFTSSRDLGEVLFAGLRVRLWPGKVREPDLGFLAKEHAAWVVDEYWQGADLVMEVVSSDPKDRDRDLEQKREEYARAGIAEYWMIDPDEERITVLKLAGKKRYAVHGEFGNGSTATSHLLPGFAVDVTAAFARRVKPAAQSGRKSKRKPLL